MAAGNGHPLANFLIYIVVVATPPMLLWLAIHGRGMYRRLRERLGTQDPVATAPPIELISLNIRRVHRDLVALPAGTTLVRRRATEHAYDALLGQAARALELDEFLDAAPDGLDRELERLRVEHLLRDAGLCIRSRRTN
ncbi:MAG: hypothetical protein ACRDQ5_10080 [Sciscionella sp.]